MPKDDEAVLESLKALLNDPNWDHRSFARIKDRFKGIPDDELRQLLIKAGATSKESRDGTELWSLEAKMTQPDEPKTGGENGKTAWDVLAGAPVWLLAIAALVFVIIVGNAMIFATQQVELGFLGKWGPTGPAQNPETPHVLPAGAVIAFDPRKQGWSTNCPPNWSLVNDAQGRFIVGAGSHAHRDSSDNPIQSYELAAIGGEQLHKLEESEIPNHSHESGTLSTSSEDLMFRTNKRVQLVTGGEETLPFVLFADGNDLGLNYGAHPHAVSGSTEAYGGSEGHNNVPPYLALYFCKKD